MATTQANNASAQTVPARLRTSIDLVALGSIPHPKARTIACRLCGHEVPRWIRSSDPETPKTSGIWLLIDHQIQAHRGEAA